VFQSMKETQERGLARQHTGALASLCILTLSWHRTKDSNPRLLNNHHAHPVAIYRFENVRGDACRLDQV
jgi:hypothetical protein